MTVIKDKLIEQYLASPHKSGDRIYVIKNDGKSEVATINKIEGDKIFVNHSYSTYKNDNPYTFDKVIKNTGNIGINPFALENYFKKINLVNFSLEVLLEVVGFDCRRGKPKDTDIPELDWNPYVLNKKGEKIHYQRGFVWSLKDKQLLIETIYNFGNIGSFILRRNDATEIYSKYNKGLETRAFQDIIDGKQRLNAIISFVMNEFSDLDNRYFDDFFETAKQRFFNYSALSTGIVENVSDDEVLKIFLRVNYTGVQMDINHLNWIKNINL